MSKPTPIRSRDGKRLAGSIGNGKVDLPTSNAQPAQHQDTPNIDETPQDNLAAIYARFKEKHGRAPVIGLDLDGVTANMVAGFREIMAEKHGINSEEAKTKLPEPDEYNMWTGEAAWFESKQEFLEHFQAAEKSGLYRSLDSFEGASDVIHRLVAEGFEVKAVTGRSEEYNLDTAAWITAKGLPVDEIIHPGFFKHTVEEVDIFIDDAPHVINDLVEHERKVIIFDQNYNTSQANEHEDHTRRIDAWEIGKVGQALEELLD